MTEHVPADRMTRAADPIPALSMPGAAAPPAPRKRGLRRLVVAVLVLGLAAAAGRAGHHYWTDGRFFVSTDNAYVKADMATISAKVGGYVTSVPVVENQRVSKGDVIAQIDPLDYQLAVDAAQGRIETQGATIERIGAQARVQRAAIDQARAMLTAAEADRARAQSEFVRTTDLIQHNYGTQQRLEQARADRDRTVATVANVQAQVAAADANLAVLDAQRVEAVRLRDELRVALDRAKRDLDFATVRAPFDGVVGNKSVQPGQFVQPGARLLSLVPPETAYVEANFKETQIAALRPGQTAVLRLDARAAEPVIGTVESFAPASGAQFSMLPPENATGNFTKIVQRLPIRIRIPAEIARTGVFAPGLSVVVDVDTRTGPQPAK